MNVNNSNIGMLKFNPDAPKIGVNGSSWEFMRHLILWSKGHYPMLGTRAVRAMQLIMEDVSWTELRFIDKSDAADFIVDTFVTYVPARRIVQMLQERIRTSWFTRQGIDELFKLVQDMAGMLACVPVKELPDLGLEDLWAHARLVESEEDRDEDLEDFRLDYPPCPGCHGQYYACLGGNNCDTTIGPYKR